MVEQYIQKWFILMCTTLSKRKLNKTGFYDNYKNYNHGQLSQFKN